MTGPSRRTTIRPGNSYWDSCLFIALLTGEARPKEETDEIDRQQDLFDKGRLHLYTSSLTIVEILEGNYPPGVVKNLQLVFQRSNFHLEQVTQRICYLAHDIRDFYARQPDKFGPFSTPDALHLATAIVAKCDYFFTFDGSTGKPSKKNCRTILPAAPSLKSQFGLNVVMPFLPPDPNKTLALEFPSFEHEDEDI